MNIPTGIRRHLAFALFALGIFALGKAKYDIAVKRIDAENKRLCADEPENMQPQDCKGNKQ